MSLQSFILLTCFFFLVDADWQYKTRPDLAPPNLNITISQASSISTGYIFVAPYTGRSWADTPPFGPIQPGPYIFTETGELVWSGFGYFSAWGTNFQTAKWKGEDVLFGFEGSRNARHGHSHGHVKIINNQYEAVKEVRGGRHQVIDLHEFHILDEKTALIEIYQPIPYDLQSYGAGPKSQWIVDARFQEIDIESGRVVFEWKSLDHIRPDESVAPISQLAFGTGYNSSDALDYFHINSVDRDAENNYLVSGRHTSTIYKINGTSGQIIWRLGGKYSNFTLGEGVLFGLQHHARYISKSDDGETETISLFDNSGDQIHHNGNVHHNRSSGKIISVSTKTWSATLLQVFHAPDDIFAFSQGSTQLLPNGNALVNWGSGGAITEYLPNGTIIFHAYLDSGELWENGDVQNYRGFRFNWTAAPTEDIAIVALTHGESTMVYVSWNGDTETKNWRIWGVDTKGREVSIGEVKKEGFETGFYVSSEGHWVAFFAEAISSEGEVVRKSETVGKEKYIYPYVPGRDDFIFGDSTQGVFAEQSSL